MLRLFARKRNERSTDRVFLAAFGKHPGWDDHIEDLGLETEQLITTKRLLYVEGIGGNLDSGDWDRLSQDQQLDGYNHLFVWWTAADVVVGRMWSSSDGKGRSRYPMVVSAQCSRLPLAWVLQQVPVRLEQIKNRCVDAASATAVRSIVSDGRRGLRQLAQHVESAREQPRIPGGWLAELADNPVLGPDHVGLHRILYSIGEAMSGDSVSNSGVAGPGAKAHFHIRVPACADAPSEAARLWLDFLRGELEKPNTFVLLFPLGESWMDIVVGEPTAKELYCLRVSPEGIPLTTEIPYTLDRHFVDRMEARVAVARQSGGS